MKQEAAAGQAVSLPSNPQNPLWIGIYLPQLPLETVLRGSPSPEAWAVAENDHILLADRKAQARGVRPGMLTTAALALAPQLRIRARDAAAETESLLGLAAWVAQFTPSVALEFPDALLLEVAGSLKLFGGLEKILATLRTGFPELGFSVNLACAPTARAASWLARAATPRPAGKQTPATPPIATPETLEAAIAALPVSLLRGKADLPDALASLGIATLGEWIALPRDGLARRFGQAVLDQTDQALNRLPDPRIFFTLPPRFQAAIELPAEVTQAEALLFAGKRLLAQLAGFLAARSGGVQRFAFRLSHREGRHTEIAIGLVAPSRDADHFAMLLRERLGQLTLGEPVRALALDAEDVQPLAGTNRSLLPDDKASSAASEWPQLIERLRARLGAQAVHAIAVAEEHRPEYASRLAQSAPGISAGKQAGSKPVNVRSTSARNTGARNTNDRNTRNSNANDRSTNDRQSASQLQFAFGQSAFGERPFWLLDAPRPLPEHNAVPRHEDGPLTLLAGPERIESGWWDGGDVKRDYFIARTPRDALVWVYRERQAGWYLHGIFS